MAQLKVTKWSLSIELNHDAITKTVLQRKLRDRIVNDLKATQTIRSCRMKLELSPVHTPGSVCQVKTPHWHFLVIAKWAILGSELSGCILPTLKASVSDIRKMAKWEVFFAESEWVIGSPDSGIGDTIIEDSSPRSDNPVPDHSDGENEVHVEDEVYVSKPGLKGASSVADRLEDSAPSTSLNKTRKRRTINSRFFKKKHSASKLVRLDQTDIERSILLYATATASTADEAIRLVGECDILFAMQNIQYLREYFTWLFETQDVSYRNQIVTKHDFDAPGSSTISEQVYGVVRSRDSSKEPVKRRLETMFDSDYDEKVPVASASTPKKTRSVAAGSIPSNVEKNFPEEEQPPNQEEALESESPPRVDEGGQPEQRRQHESDEVQDPKQNPGDAEDPGSDFEECIKDIDVF